MSRRDIQFWSRDEPPPPSNSSSGFVGGSGNQNPDNCTKANLYVQGGGQLSDSGKPLSVDPGVSYIDISNFPGGSIATTLTVENGILVWRNESFYNGVARYCQTAGGSVYAEFAQEDVPLK
ncbi:hypothetical protein F4780DRAFT_774211 [Xylariomycetidae sp. FL0641]|nr:hypothetical protein F4780DRAFT_774211 [Xylariomycetidae sp. FL0641]